jgi:hypothetical protein
MVYEFCLQGGGQNHTARKPSLVLGVHPSPIQKGRKESFIGNKKQRPLYNHCEYAFYKRN